MYFKDRDRTSKTVYCISCSIVCKIFFAQKAGRVPRRTQAIVKHFAFHANARKLCNGGSNNIRIALDDRNRKRRFMFYFCNFAHFQCCIIQLSNFLSCFRMQVLHTK